MGMSSNELRILFNLLSPESSSKIQVCIATLSQPYQSIRELALDLILYGLTHSRSPSFIQFDTRLQGYSSLNISNIDARGFPPQTDLGYSFIAWFFVETFDPIVPLTLLGITDDENRCFMRAIIDPKSRTLTVQTSMRNKFIFTDFEFHPKHWYQFVLVHQRSTFTLGTGNITLYVNGNLIQSIRCPYLSIPAARSNIQSHIDTIIILYNLGSRYRALFQDPLYQLRVNELSTTSHLRPLIYTSQKGDEIEFEKLSFENMPRKIVKQLFQEGKIVFAFSAENVVSERFNSGLADAGFSEQALLQLDRADIQEYPILNTSMVNLDTSLSSQCGTGYLVGDPLPVIMKGLDDTVWKVGGCPILLSLIEHANCATVLQKILVILLELIKHNWRNSDEMMRSKGYEILANLLKRKRALITEQIFETLIVFLGKNSQSPKESIINNPIAYRSLILDFDLWKQTEIAVQMAHLDQFVVFIETSQRKCYNTSCLLHMHLVSKMLRALRIGAYDKELTSKFVYVFKLMVRQQFTTETIRDISTTLLSLQSKAIKAGLEFKQSNFIDSENFLETCQKSESSFDSAFEKSSTKRQEPPPLIHNVVDYSNRNSSKYAQLCNLLLGALSDILCDPESTIYAKKFASKITNRWTFIFFTEGSDPYTVVLAARILARQFYCTGATHGEKFRIDTNGFALMKTLLMHYYNVVELYPVLLALMLGIDVAKIPLNTEVDLTFLLQTFGKNCSSSLAITQDIMPTILAMMRGALDLLVNNINLFIENQKTLIEGDSLLQPIAKKNSEATNFDKNTEKILCEHAQFQQILISFFSQLSIENTKFVNICLVPESIELLVNIIFHLICACDPVSIETELHSKGIGLTFDSVTTIKSYTGAETSIQPIISDNLVSEPENIENAYASVPLELDKSNAPYTVANINPLKRGMIFTVISRTRHSVPKICENLYAKNLIFPSQWDFKFNYL
ncbi:uncharacterized protein VTP21DRAFT_10483 [Calcarisporiella thermophila]|uniref:uncharacterized protein n=1 Tax=Calcarisporiella thermophila TaxID=911321 RepID=UPI0037436D32